MSDNLPKYTVEMMKARLSTCIITKSSVKAYYGIEVYLHAIFTTVPDGDLPLTSKPDRYFPI